MTVYTVHMKTMRHKSDTRGHARHEWLDRHHTFRFARYFDPPRLNFGMLHVSNDDIVQASMGFCTHPYENMEIISIPLEKDLENKDSMSHSFVIRKK